MCPGSESETNEEILRLTSVITDLEAQMVDLYGKYRKEKRKNRRKGKKKNKKKRFKDLASMCFGFEIRHELDT